MFFLSVSKSLNFKLFITHVHFLFRLHFHIYHKHWIIINTLCSELGKHLPTRTQRLERCPENDNHDDWGAKMRTELWFTSSTCFTYHNAFIMCNFYWTPVSSVLTVFNLQNKVHQRKKLVLYFYVSSFLSVTQDLNDI